MTGEKEGALNGVRVIELGSLLAGPFCCRILADFGSEVIKIEQPEDGDILRVWGHVKYDGHSLLWPIQARNKKCVTLNLRLQEGQDLLKRLIAKSDVVVENFRPGTLEKWNLGYEEMSRINPGIILTRISGYGQTGPYKERAGFGSAAGAMSGLRYLTGYPDRPPTRVGISVEDSTASLFGVIGTLMALNHRNKTGKGQCIDVALHEAVFALMESITTEYFKVGAIRERTGSTLPGVAPSNLYWTKDEKWVLIAGNADNVFHRLAAAMGKPELAEDERFKSHTARGNNVEAVDGIVNDWTKERAQDEILEILDKAGVPAAAIYNAADIAKDPHYLDREMILSVVDPELGELKVPGIVPKLSLTPGAVKWTGPRRRGEHNEDVFGGVLGMSKEELDQYKARGVI